MLAFFKLALVCLLAFALGAAAQEHYDTGLVPKWRWHFRVRFHRYSDHNCKDDVGDHNWIHAGECQNFKHAFTGFAYQWAVHGEEKDATKYGDCYMRSYTDQHCSGGEVDRVPGVSTNLCTLETPPW